MLGHTRCAAAPRWLCGNGGARRRPSSLKLASFASGVVLLVWAAPLMPKPAPPELVIPAALAPGVLAPNEQQRVNTAIDRGVDYLRRNQLADGSWVDSSTGRTYPVAYGALPGL